MAYITRDFCEKKIGYDAQGQSAKLALDRVLDDIFRDIESVLNLTAIEKMYYFKFIGDEIPHECFVRLVDLVTKLTKIREAEGQGERADDLIADLDSGYGAVVNFPTVVSNQPDHCDKGDSSPLDDAIISPSRGRTR